MARPVEDPFEKFQAEIESKYYAAIMEIAQEMTFQIEAAYETVIQSFYEEYTPRVYRRTGYTYKASDRYDDPFGITPLGDGIYESGIHVDPMYFEKGNPSFNPYAAPDKAWVFDRTFGQGIHGYFRWEMTEWANKKWTYMNKKFVMSKKRREKLAKLLEKKIKHSPARFSRKLITATISSLGDIIHHKNEDIFKPMSTYASTPKEGMDNAFKKLTSKKHLDAVTSNIMKKYFS